MRKKLVLIWWSLEDFQLRAGAVSKAYLRLRWRWTHTGYPNAERLISTAYYLLYSFKESRDLEYVSTGGVYARIVGAKYEIAIDQRLINAYVPVSEE